MNKHKKKSRKKQIPFFERIVKNFNIIFIFLLILLILSPMFVWLCYSVIPPIIKTDLTADGILVYLCTSIAAIISLLTCIIALYQSRRAEEIQEEFEIETRRQEIYPNFTLTLTYNTNTNENTYTIEFHNHSKNPAIGIYINTIEVVPILKPMETLKLQISTTNFKNFLEVFYDNNIVFKDEVYPQIIPLYFLDIDKNVIAQQYKYIGNNLYDPEKPEYY